MEIPEGFTPSATFYKENTYNHLSFVICRWGETLNLGFKNRDYTMPWHILQWGKP